MIPDFKTYLKESIWTNINKRSEGNLERKEDTLPIDEMEKFIDRSLEIYAHLYVFEGWEENGEELTYDIFAEVVKTSDSMQDIDEYENYTEDQLDYILRYAKKKWDVYLKKLKEYVMTEKIPF